MSEEFNQDEEIRERRKRRMAEMRRNKEKQLRRRQYLQKLLPVIGSALLLVIVITVMIGKMAGNKDRADQESALNREQDKIEGIDQNTNQDTMTDMEKDVDQDIGMNAEQYAETDVDTGKEQAETGFAEKFIEKGKEEDRVLTEKNGKAGGETETAEETSILTSAVLQPKEQAVIPSAKETASTLFLGDEIISSYAVLIDLDKDEIVAQKLAKQRINPASMTKVLTVLVAAEHVTDLEDTFTMTIDITDYSYVNDCSSVGFLVDEVITVEDLFYGTVLPSGGDAAVGLATYVAGSQEEFVKLMNDKLEELGLSETAHVTNCVGLYDEDHYCTVYDMAMIMEAAIENELCRKVLSEHTYTTSATAQHPEGIQISNWFLRKIEDKDTGGVVMCGKTGYVVQSGNCAVSYGIADSGKEFICVTADATSGWRCIYDHVALYKQFAES